MIDTNVLISAGLITRSTPRRVLEWVLEHGSLLASAQTIEEFATRFVSRDKFDRYSPPEQRRNFLSRVMGLAEHVEVTSRLAVCGDPDDDRFVELAVDGGADCIVTGNTRDFPPSHAGIPVLTPAQFAQTYVEA